MRLRRLLMGGFNAEKIRQCALYSFEQNKCIVRASIDPVTYPIGTDWVLRIKSFGMLVGSFSIAPRVVGSKAVAVPRALTLAGRRDNA